MIRIDRHVEKNTCLPFIPLPSPPSSAKSTNSILQNPSSLLSSTAHLPRPPPPTPAFTPSHPCMSAWPGQCQRRCCHTGHTVARSPPPCRDIGQWQGHRSGPLTPQSSSHRGNTDRCWPACSTDPGNHKRKLFNTCRVFHPDHTQVRGFVGLFLNC